MESTRLTLDEILPMMADEDAIDCLTDAQFRLLLDVIQDILLSK